MTSASFLLPVAGNNLQEFTHARTHPDPTVLTSVTAGAVGGSGVHAGGAGVVAQVTPAVRPVPPPGALCHTAPVTQGPISNQSTLSLSLL